MADDILGDMLRAHDGPGEAPQARGFGDVVGRAVSSGRQGGSPPSVPAADPAPLLALDQHALARLLRYLPADAIVPLLGRAPVALAQRIVGLMDAESQAWLASQSEEIEATTPQAHDAALRRALALVDRAKASPAQPAAPPAAPPARPARPVEVGMSFDAGPVAQPVQVAQVGTPPPASQPAAPAPPAAPVADDLVESLASVVALAAGRGPQQLAEIAASVDHPVLTAALREIAGGGDGHAVDEAVRGAGHDWLLAQTRQVELIRLAALAIRFGDGPQRFREQAEQV